MSMILPMKQNDFHGCSIYALYYYYYYFYYYYYYYYYHYHYYELRIYVPSLTIC